MRLRLSDTRSHAEEFTASTLSEFVLGVYEALKRYAEHFSQRNHAAPRPHLHLRPDNTWGARGKWIDVGYGRGTHIVLYTDMMQNTSYLSEIWDRCQQAARNSDIFEAGFAGLLDSTAREVILENGRDRDGE